MSNLRDELMAGVAHSSIGPSSAHRWMRCAASVGFIKRCGLDDEEAGEEAARGTVAHAIGAECLLTGREAWEFAGEVRKEGSYEFTVDEDMVSSVQTWIDFVLEKMKQYEGKGAMLYVERRVWTDYDDEGFGTSDTIIEVPGERIIITDFKNGMVIVDPADEQLKLYGQYAYERRSEAMRGRGEPRTIDLYIVQPRMPHPKGVIRKHITNPDELDNWMLAEVVPAMQETRNPDALFVVGSHCKYCPANTSGRCPAVKSEIAKLPVEKPVETLTNEEIAHFRKIKKVIGKFLDGVDKEAFVRVKDKGEKIEGCKLVHKLGDRQFKSQMKVLVDDGVGGEKEVDLTIEQHLVKTFGEKAWTDKKLKSPAQIEKLPGGKAITAQWAYKPDTGLTLADEEDAREPAVGLMQLADQAASSEVPV